MATVGVKGLSRQAACAWFGAYQFCFSIPTWTPRRRVARLSADDKQCSKCV